MAKKSFRTAIDKTKLNERSGIKSLVSSPAAESKETETPKPVEDKIPEDIRQTFIVREDYLEKLKDYVHMIRISEDSYYTQKDAMHEALDMLFESAGEIPNRPEKLKQREKDRAQRIKRARNR